MLRYMLDTNQVSDIVRGTSIAARQKLRSLGPEEIACISAITEGEILYGLAKTPHSRNFRETVDDVLGRVKILSWGRHEAAVYGILRAQQRAIGKNLETMDLLIASHAISTGSILVSRDKVFRHVLHLPGLVNWATEVD